MMEIEAELRKYASTRRARVMAGFFRTGPGEYGEGDVFIGVAVPHSRIVAKIFRDADRQTIGRLLSSKIHEERLTGFLILVEQFKSGDAGRRRAVYEFYMENLDRVNNWDLVDLTADKIVGEFLLERDRAVLYRLARSESVWERRIAIIATFAFIKKGECRETFRIAEILIDDRHDLIHKAVGWMLREAGKRCGQEKEEEFLRKHYKRMPRTMLRYAIEKFQEKKRKFYMA